MKIIVRGIEIDLSEVVTESDLMDIAEKHDIPSNEIFNAMYELEVKGTPCEGCKHIGLRFSFDPCSSCSRNPDVKDYYERDGKKRPDYKSI